MIYKISNNNLIIKNIEQNEEYSIDISGFKEITSITADSSGEYIAIIGIEETEKDVSIFIHKLGSTDFNKIYTGKVYDLIWFRDKTKILFHTGTTICMIQIDGSDFQKLIKISRVNYAPIMLSLSPDESKVAYIKWKSDNKKIFLYDLLKKEEHGLSISCFDYDWVDNQTIIYDSNNKIKIFDLNLNKSSTLFKDVSSLRKMKDFSKVCSGAEKVLLSGEPEDLIVNNVGRPRHRNGKIYFEIFAATNRNKVIAILSVNKDLTNLCLHFTSEQGLIFNYDIITEDIIAVNISKNELANETIQSGLRYYNNQIEINYNGFYPLQCSKQPTRMEHIIIN
ncbi:MAG: hypothetical protein K0R00_3975 [Herbinix sp.]|nr:hypothetical protein [Herbinix sp.]